MGNVDLRHMRRWLVVLNTLNLLVMTGNYGYLTFLHREEERPNYWITVTDWTLIIFTSIFFVAYVYSLRGKRVLEKHLRVFWMLIPCLTLLGITLNKIRFEIWATGRIVDTSSSSDPPGAFACGGDPDCILLWSLTFLTAITGLFSLIEIGMAFVWGPLEPRTNLYGQQGYNAGAQVTIVAPYQQLQPQMQQMVYPPQQQQPGFVAPQPLQQQQQQPSFAPIDANTPAGIMAQPYQFTGQQQQQYQSFTQPAPLQPYQPSPSPQPSPGATASSPGTHR
ncbi:hypothetical protein BGZ95_004836 [Linnemannia exigua]|uniref:Uncharacterized protein n=1 Tax=Linnemannia exigua TaxID=604196 RepID=A0AAD4DH36_9FUNG|nr:hypothetical protein BGZ95_004836 [Linnemannia exigua]